VPQPDQIFKQTKDFEICIRPERIRTYRHGEKVRGVDGNVNRLTGTIVNIAHLGADIHQVVKINNGRRILVTEQFVGQNLEQAGEEVTIIFRPEDVIIVPAGS